MEGGLPPPRPVDGGSASPAASLRRSWATLTPCWNFSPRRSPHTSGTGARPFPGPPPAAPCESLRPGEGRLGMGKQREGRVWKNLWTALETGEVILSFPEGCVFLTDSPSPPSVSNNEIFGVGDLGRKSSWQPRKVVRQSGNWCGMCSPARWS